MPAGFQSFNLAGFLQTDGSNRNLQFKNKWTTNTTQSLVFSDTSGNYLQRVLTPSFASDCPVLAVRCDYPIANMGIVYDQPNGTASCEFLVHVTSPVQVDFYAFELMKSANTGFGLQVFDGAGQVVFDACQKPFRVSGYIQTGGNGAHGFPAGKTYAMAVSDMIGSIVTPPASPWPVNTLFVKNSGASIISELITHRANPGWVGTTADFYSSVGQVVVLDVTGF